MKKFFIFFIVAISLACACYFALASSGNKSADTDYLRIHVRANSNSQEDQAIKYEVKDKVVEFITPYITQCVTKQKAMEVIGSVTSDIENVCDEWLKAKGFTYKSNAEIRSEQFPTRVYGDLTLEEGIYDALIIELGTGEGDNWWCVIYPPLCFTSASCDVEYRSIVLEIIEKFKNSRSL